MRPLSALGVAVFLLFFAASAATQDKATKPRKSLLGSEAKSIDAVRDARLNAILGYLATREVLPVDATAAVADSKCSEETVVVIPLQDRANPDGRLYLYYLPVSGSYAFLEAGLGNSGQPEMRLWSKGPHEIYVTAEGAGLRAVDPETQIQVPDRFFPMDNPSGPDVISCLGSILGVSLDFTNLSRLISSAACSVLSGPGNILDLVLTATNCLSMFGIGANDIFAPIGCITGAAKLISCGYLSCTSAPPPSCTVTPISFNTSVSGTLGSDCNSTHRSGRYARFYSFTLSSQTHVQIDLQSSSFDAYLFLLQGSGTNGTVVASNDDYSGANSRIAQDLSAGSYTIEATSYGSGSTGSFTVSVATPTTTPPPPTGGCTVTPISFNASVSGSLGSDCNSTHRSGRYARFYSFTLSSQTQVQIDLQSSTFDTYLFLLQGSGTNGTVVTSNDDYNGSNSRIVQTLSAGSYTVEATSYSGGVTGTFVISVAR
jgi:hypothetical protein